MKAIEIYRKQSGFTPGASSFFCQDEVIVKLAEDDTEITFPASVLAKKFILSQGHTSSEKPVSQISSRNGAALLDGVSIEDLRQNMGQLKVLQKRIKRDYGLSRYFSLQMVPAIFVSLVLFYIGFTVYALNAVKVNKNHIAQAQAQNHVMEIGSQKIATLEKEFHARQPLVTPNIQTENINNGAAYQNSSSPSNFTNNDGSKAKQSVLSFDNEPKAAQSSVFNPSKFDNINIGK